MQKLQPQLAEFLRTCIHPASLFLRVAQVQHLDLKHDYDVIPSEYDAEHRYATKYVLTDGSLMIQALLHRKLSGLKEAAKVDVGDCLDIHRSTLKKAERTHGQGKVAYLLIQDCHFLLQPLHTRALEKQSHIGLNVTNGSKRKRQSQSPDILCQLEEQGSTETILSTKKIKLPAAEAAQTVDPNGNEILRKDRKASKDASIPVHETTVPPQLAVSFSSTHHVIDLIQPSSGQTGPATNLSEARKSKDLARCCSKLEDSDEEDYFECVTSNTSAIIARRGALHKLHPDSTSMQSETDNFAVSLEEQNVRVELSTPTFPENETCRAGTVADADLSESVLSGEGLRLVGSDQHNGDSNAFKTPDGTFCLPQPAAQGPATDSTLVVLCAKQAQRSTTQVPMLPAPPFHTLDGLRNPPHNRPLPTKSYNITTLAFISWTGTNLIHGTNPAFPPKRHVKIVDPSLSGPRPQSRERLTSSANVSSFQPRSAFQDSVTLAVYLEAADFSPPVGTLALLRGVTMQKLRNGDVILNAYPRLKEQRFQGPSGKSESSEDVNESEPAGRWFITDRTMIRDLGYGSKLDCYLEWWDDKSFGTDSRRIAMP